MFVTRWKQLKYQGRLLFSKTCSVTTFKLLLSPWSLQFLKFAFSVSMLQGVTDVVFQTVFFRVVYFTGGQGPQWQRTPECWKTYACSGILSSLSQELALSQAKVGSLETHIELAIGKHRLELCSLKVVSVWPSVLPFVCLRMLLVSRSFWPFFAKIKAPQRRCRSHGVQIGCCCWIADITKMCKRGTTWNIAK